ncbi:VOC family protein [Hirschia litorea]|uniref:VOC family protein n=1 Tax=Hirschia litorea TaxID=1199156 RepID=A0ABW2IGS0_9PROT
MTLLKCSTIVVENVRETAELYTQWLEYEIVDEYLVDEGLAQSWDAQRSVGAKCVVLQPSSKEAVYIRLIEGSPVTRYEPIRTYGWAATEICVKDVAKVHNRMKESPFEVIGEPRELDGFPGIKPMQVKGPNKEILYLTEFSSPTPIEGLPVPRTFIDRPFIIVMACKDLNAQIAWMKEVFGFAITEPVSIQYTMISKAFGLDIATKHPIAVVRADRADFIELDQYPTQAQHRPANDGELVPGVAICSFEYEDFESLDNYWFSNPVIRHEFPYCGKRVGILKSPENALFEIVER